MFLIDFMKRIGVVVGVFYRMGVVYGDLMMSNMMLRLWVDDRLLNGYGDKVEKVKVVVGDVVVIDFGFVM